MCVCYRCKNPTKVIGILAAIGKGQTDDFNDRKLNQKSIFLLDKLGIKNIKYRYNWYIHGPYSPDLTEDIFDVEAFLPTIGERNVLNAEDYQILDTYRELLESLNGMAPDEAEEHEKLELVTSMLYFYEIAPSSIQDIKSLVMNSVQVSKSQFADWDLEAYWNLIERYELII